MQTANSTLTIQIVGKRTDVPMASFLRVATQTLSILREIDADLSLRLNPVGVWRISDIRKAGGTITIQVYRDTDLAEGQIGEEAVSAYLEGFRRMDSQPVVPPHFSIASVARVKRMYNVLHHDGLADVTFSRNNESVKPTAQVAVNARKVIKNVGEFYYEDTTLEGNLDSVNVHGEQRFFIYEDITGHRVFCKFTGEAMLNEVRKALAKRVAVTGSGKFHRSGRPVQMKVAEIYIFREESALKRIADMPPIDVTGGESSETYVRRLFNGD
jgi:hypothetical protein